MLTLAKEPQEAAEDGDAASSDGGDDDEADVGPCLCEEGHVLQEYTPATDGFCCEECGEDLAEGEAAWFCPSCNDIAFCKGCASQRPADPEAKAKQEKRKQKKAAKAAKEAAKEFAGEETEDGMLLPYGDARVAVRSPYANIAGIYATLGAQHDSEGHSIYQRLGEPGQEALYLAFQSGAWLLTGSLKAVGGAFDRIDEDAKDPADMSEGAWQKDLITKIERTRPAEPGAAAPRVQVQSTFKNLAGRYATVPGLRREGRPVFRREDIPAGGKVQGKDLASHLLSDGGCWVLTNSLEATKVFGKTEDVADHPVGIEGAWADGSVLSIEPA